MSASVRISDKFDGIRAASARHSPHGTNARYSLGCRCWACRVGRAAYRAAYAKNRQYNNSGHGRTVSAEPARLHVLRMAKSGMGYRAISEASGVNHNIVWGIRQGDRTRARFGTVQKILATDLSCSRAGSKVPAGPTWKILRELLGRGFSKTQIAFWLGYRGKQPSLQLPRDFVTAANAVRVQRVAALLEAGKLKRGDICLPPVKPRGMGGRGRIIACPPGTARRGVR